MVQLWQDTNPEQTAVDLVPLEEVPEIGWKEVLGAGRERAECFPGA